LTGKGVGLIAFFDYLTGSGIRLGLLYLIPILLSASISRRFGFIIAIVCALLALAIDIYLQRYSNHHIYYIWELITRGTIFTLVAHLRSNLMYFILKESELARTDHLTGAMNLRAFREQLETEIYRARRYCYPLTIAYIDIDNFKTINDTLGHSEGDRVLCSVVATIKQHIRKSDIIARLGGDEFAILLPVTDWDDSHTIVNMLQGHLMDEVHKNNWTITFSIGVLICIEIPPNGEQMIEAADNLMYIVKQQGKNSINYSLFSKNN
jgi:diguanylate cyclase (GGDEF)-like protein